MCLYDVRTIVSFLFKEENYTSNLSSNYKMALELAETSSTKMIKRAEELTMTLNKLKPYMKRMTRLPVRPA